MNTCRSCHAAIRWVVTNHGRRMPLDADPDPEGNVALSSNGIAYVLSRFADTNMPRYRSHFSTCPQANQHRKATT